MKSRDLSVILLDDNRQMRMLVRAMLGGFGFRHVRGAGTVEEAKWELSNKTFDLAIVDYRLENKESGLSFCRFVRDKENSPDPYMPIIMVSSFAEEARIREAIDAGVDEFLVKPVKPRDVATRIDAIAYKRRDFVETTNYFGPDRRRLNDPRYSGPKRRFTDHAVELD